MPNHIDIYHCIFTIAALNLLGKSMVDKTYVVQKRRFDWLRYMKTDKPFFASIFHLYGLPQKALELPRRLFTNKYLKICMAIDMLASAPWL